DHRCSAIAHRSHRPSQRSSVVQGTETEIDGVRTEPESIANSRIDRESGTERRTGEFGKNALGPSGGAGRIQHVVALGLVVDRSHRKSRDDVLEALRSTRRTLPYRPSRF